MRAHSGALIAALAAAVVSISQPVLAEQATTAVTPEAPFEWHTVKSDDGRLSVDLPCNPHPRHGRHHMSGIDKPVEFEELWCVKSTGFASMGGAANFEIYRSWVAGDPALTQKAFELGVAARGGGIRLPGFSADRIFWSTDVINVMSRQPVGCTWGMEFVRDGSWWTATMGMPRRFCTSVNRATPSDAALHFLNSVQVAGQ